MQKVIDTHYGNFQSETGLAAVNRFKNEKNGNEINYTDNFQVQLLLGFTYKYTKDLLFRIGLPFTVYQNGGWFTNYSVQLQLDKMFGISK